MSKRYIECSCCGKRIYEGEIFCSVDGIIYKCCSYGCLCKLMLNPKIHFLTDEYMKNEEEEWDGEEE